MRRKMLLAGLTLAIALPAAAHAQETCEQRSQNRTTGTVVGGLLGALVGSSVAGHGHKSDGAVVGAVAGAVVGNQVAKGPKDCQHAYGWYDNSNRWHANNVDANAAWGYYDRRGEWVEGRPADYRPVEYRGPDRDRGGDWDRFDFETRGYSEFSDTEHRIHDEIRDAFRAGAIRRDTAEDLMGQLRDIRADETRLYRDDGERLRHEDRMRLRMRLRDLDRRVDRARRVR